MFHLLLVLLIGYALIGLLVWSQQDRFVFPGAGRGERPVDVPGVEVLSISGSFGAQYKLVRKVPTSPRAVLAFFVGNGEDLCSAARHTADLAEYGIAVVSAEYPGYGGSKGQPGVYSFMALADAVAAHASALARQLGVPFVVGGSSLGSFCAVHVAASGAAARCLLRAPPSSLVDAASVPFWWLPVRLLLRHKFDNTAAAARVRCPVLILHGDQDRVVPLALGQRLCSLFAGPAELVLVEGAGHNDLSLSPHGLCAARIGTFLRGP
ncbi:MAG: alpha/beta hydrolase [Planctomycetota bacterium]